MKPLFKHIALVLALIAAAGAVTPVMAGDDDPQGPKIGKLCVTDEDPQNAALGK